MATNHKQTRHHKRMSQIRGRTKAELGTEASSKRWVNMKNHDTSLDLPLEIGKVLYSPRRCRLMGGILGERH